MTFVSQWSVTIGIVSVIWEDTLKGLLGKRKTKCRLLCVGLALEVHVGPLVSNFPPWLVRMSSDSVLIWPRSRVVPRLLITLETISIMNNRPETWHHLTLCKYMQWTCRWIPYRSVNSEMTFWMCTECVVYSLSLFIYFYYDVLNQIDYVFRYHDLMLWTAIINEQACV